jgi:hypothetical protein
LTNLNPSTPIMARTHSGSGGKEAPELLVTYDYGFQKIVDMSGFDEATVEAAVKEAVLLGAKCPQAIRAPTRLTRPDQTVIAAGETPAGHELELERKFGEFSTFADVTPTATGLAENHPFVLNLQTQMWAYCNENGEPHENPAAEKLMKEWGMADAQFKWETLDNYSDRV